MKTLSWLVLKSIQQSSEDFSHCLAICSSLLPLPSLEKQQNLFKTGADYTHFSTWHFSAPFFHPPSSIQTFTAESSLCINIRPVIWSWRSKAPKVCFQLPCHPLIPLLSVYSRIWVRKSVLGQLIPAHLIPAAGRWLAAAPRLICVENESPKTSFAAVVNQMVNATLAWSTVCLHGGPLCACLCICSCLCVWQNWAMVFLLNNHVHLKAFKSHTLECQSGIVHI